MIINRAKLADADYRFHTLFNKVFMTMRERLTIDPLVQEVPSLGRSERYVWANSFPKLREWLDDAQFSRLSAYGFQLVNKTWQGGIELLREDLEDDQLGVVRPQIENLAAEAAYHVEDLIYTLMVNGFGSTSGLAWDGQFFFDTDHNSGATGAPTQSNKGTDIFRADTLAAAIAQMRSLKDDNNRALRIAPTDLYVGPALEYTARQILNAEVIVINSLSQTNVLKGIVNLNVWNRLSEHPTYWFLVDQSQSGIKPFVHQLREPVQFVAQDRPTDDENFMRRILRWSAYTRDNAGYAMWQAAWGSNGTTTPP